MVWLYSYVANHVLKLNCYYVLLCALSGNPNAESSLSDLLQVSTVSQINCLTVMYYNSTIHYNSIGMNSLLMLESYNHNMDHMSYCVPYNVKFWQSKTLANHSLQSFNKKSFGDLK